MWRKRTTLPLLVGLQAGTTTLEISFAVLRKLNRVLPIPQIPWLGIYTEDAPTCNKDTGPLYSYTYTMKYYSAIKSNDFMIFLDIWMDLKYIILSEVTKSQKSLHDMLTLISAY